MTRTTRFARSIFLFDRLTQHGLSCSMRRHPLAVRVLAPLIVITIIILTSLAIGIRVWFVKPQPADRHTSIVANIPATQRLEVTVITIWPRGFHPVEITRPHAPFVLAIENRSGLQVVWRLSNGAGDRLKEVSMPREKKFQQELMDLPPGNYMLTEANHPDWVCHITVTNQ